MVIRALSWVCLLVTSISARIVNDHGQTVINIVETSSGIRSCETPIAAPTPSPSTRVLPRQMSMSMMPPDTMTMIQDGETVVEVVTMDSTGSMGTTILSTVTPTGGMSGMSSGHKKPQIGKIVGAVLGSVIAVAALATTLVLWSRRNEEQVSVPDMYTVGKSEGKGSIDEMCANGHTANTIPTPLTYTVDGQQSYLQSLAVRAGIATSDDPDQPTPLSSKQAAARQQRQKELELHIRYLQDELRTLGPRPGPSSSVLVSPERVEDARQMEMMREQIALLQAQQHSSWAQGLTDEQPPGYTVDVVSRIATPDK